MKHLKIPIFVASLVAVIFSCEQKNEIKLDRVTELTNRAVSSIQFSSLKIKLSDLNLAGSKYVDASKNSIVIPFAGRDNRKGLVVIFDETDILRGLIEFEALTNVTSDQIYTEMKNGRFDGTLVYRIGGGKMSFKLENSMVISTSTARMDGTAVVCAGWDQTGTVLSCALASIDSLSWLDKTFCNFEYLTCLARHVMACILDKCPENFA